MIFIYLSMTGFVGNLHYLFFFLMKPSLIVKLGDCSRSWSSLVSVKTQRTPLKSMSQIWDSNLTRKRSRADAIISAHPPTHHQKLFKADRRQIITLYQLILLSIRLRLRSITHFQCPMSHLPFPMSRLWCRISRTPVLNSKTPVSWNSWRFSLCSSLTL